MYSYPYYFSCPSIVVLHQIYIPSMTTCPHPTSCAVSFLMNLAGFPPHSSPEGILLAGGTTVPGAIIDSDSRMAPSHTTERAPIRTYSHQKSGMGIIGKRPHAQSFMW